MLKYRLRNRTINCDSLTAFQASRNPEQFRKYIDFRAHAGPLFSALTLTTGWTESNVTALCTTGCANSLSAWLAAVERQCDGETLLSTGGYLLPKSIPTDYLQGHELVCQQDTSSNWCYVESLTWQGSDYIRYSDMACHNENEDEMPPECNDPWFSTSFITPEMKDITRLYDKDLLCSECFIQIWRQRLMSSRLPKDEFTDYLLEQYESIQEFCSVSLPVSTYSSTLFIRPTIPTSTVPATTVPSTPATTDTCDGQFVEADDDKRLPCLRMSDTYNVSTGTLEYITGSYSCYFEGVICLPKPCELDIVYGSNTCEALAAKYSTDDSPVSLTQFLAWNPYLQGTCDRVNHVQRICKGPPGGRFKPSGVIAVPTGPGEYFTTAHPAEPTQPGTTESCGRYYKVASGDTCNSIALRFGITVPDFQDLNTQIWDNCTNLWLDYDVCVAPVSATTVSENGTCGPSYANTICEGSSFGDCCSTSGYCGTGVEYCRPGNCVSGACEPNNGATTNGTCGPDWGYTTCSNPSFGRCCSVYGYCGNGKEFCGPGLCYSGECDPDMGGPSINGECGPSFAGSKSCTGTQFGDCCSVNGYCGSSDDYCGAGSCYSGACKS
ncbi:hypothetical protein P170DRAFT_416613 [Aspergillus steynii IBT 23096]|uniref:Carbohydrate-binding module family 18 protein n=1 Tax=Aspergillus steynii IBT 23096 TaxID=1392250 RepID=A0A2I2FU50_9EURO|nr:uncharacterized protein P170DRAFT_416613 [Aspergillus steynii IBT 23096]PLB44169.1 hypothetical protein P170DRAFT_416613 [Aspergillus steynii IBT 23096]